MILIIYYLLASLYISFIGCAFLFTNVPVNLALNSIKKRWVHISTNKYFERGTCSYYKFVLNSIFFIFNNKFYKQVFGTSMDSALSPIIADMAMQDLEEIAISSPFTSISIILLQISIILFFHFHLKILTTLLLFLILYIQDYNLPWRLALTIDWIFSTLLWLLIIDWNKRIIFNTYHKTTFSGKFLNFHSNHPKRCIIIQFRW